MITFSPRIKPFAAVAMTLGLTGLGWVIALLGAAGFHVPAEPSVLPSGAYLYFVVIAPLLETPLVMLFMKGAPGISWGRAALCDVVMGLMHCLSWGWVAVGQIMVCFFNALIYSAWRNGTSWQVGFTVAFLMHALHNLCAVLMPEFLFDLALRWVQ